MSDLSWPLQQAIYDALLADGDLTSLMTGVYDQAPAEAVLPYVTLGPTSATDWSSASFSGQDHDLAIDVWTTGPGHGQAKRIMAAVYGALHDRDLTIAGGNLVLLQFRFSDVFTDADGETVHGAMRFRALTHSLG
jgi:hypothetical protein